MRARPAGKHKWKHSINKVITDGKVKSNLFSGFCFLIQFDFIKALRLLRKSNSFSRIAGLAEQIMNYRVIFPFLGCFASKIIYNIGFSSHKSSRTQFLSRNTRQTREGLGHYQSASLRTFSILSKFIGSIDDVNGTFLFLFHYVNKSNHAQVLFCGERTITWPVGRLMMTYRMKKRENEMEKERKKVLSSMWCLNILWAKLGWLDILEGRAHENHVFSNTMKTNFHHQTCFPERFIAISFSM